MIKVALVGDYNPEVKAHRAIPDALRLAAESLGRQVSFDWVATPTLDQDADGKLANYDAIWIVPASPYASMQGALNAIRRARLSGVPILGTCGGYQHMIIEFARDVMGISDADHAEMHPEGASLLVTSLSCTVSEVTNVFKLALGSKVAAAYGADEATEQYGTCNYGLNPAFSESVDRAGFRIVGTDTDGETRIMELDDHPFFVGMLFQPERSAFRGVVHPVIRAFLNAVK